MVKKSGGLNDNPLLLRWRGQGKKTWGRLKPRVDDRMAEYPHKPVTLIQRENFTDAYVDSLRRLLARKKEERVSRYFLIVEIQRPISNVHVKSDNYRKYLNLNKKIHTSYEKHKFSKSKKFGKKWISNRINFLCPKNMEIKTSPLNEKRDLPKKKEVGEVSSLLG